LILFFYNEKDADVIIIISLSAHSPLFSYLPNLSSPPFVPFPSYIPLITKEPFIEAYITNEQSKKKRPVSQGKENPT
jgi:hypothetical protein